MTKIKMISTPNGINELYIKYINSLTNKAHPLGYLITETIPNIYYSITGYFIDKLYKLSNRYINKYYLVDTRLDKYNFHDTSNIMLYANFSILVDHVECELASMYKFCYHTHIDDSPIFKKFRSPELGLKYCVEHVESYTEYLDVIFSLYVWWTRFRPIRIDPHDEYNRLVDSIISDVDEKFYFSEEWRKQNPELFSSIRTALDNARKIEQQYEDEDTEMLTKLISIRTKLLP